MESYIYAVPVRHSGMSFADIVVALREPALAAGIHSHWLLGEVNPSFENNNLTRYTTVLLENAQFEVCSIIAEMKAYVDEDNMGIAETLMAEIKPIPGTEMYKYYQEHRTLPDRYVFKLRTLCPPGRILTIDAYTI